MDQVSTNLSKQDPGHTSLWRATRGRSHAGDPQLAAVPAAR
jgi:hypothetical protein